jgi:hypothetical protein
MKDKKFAVLCGLGLVWLLIFVAMLFGAKVNPRVEQLITILCLGWFAFWSISWILTSSKSTQPPTKTDNAKTQEKSGTE